MKNIFFLLIALPVFCFGQQPGFRRLYNGQTTGATFVDIVWDGGDKLIATGQFLTDTAPNSALNGLLIKSDAMGNEIWRKYYGSPGLYCGIQEPYVIDDNNILLPGFKIYEGNGSITNSWGRSWMILVGRD